MAGYLGATPVPQATQHRESFTATSGQTTFATAGYTAGFVDVYLNGSHLSPADFTATNGSDVVLASGASADDVCDIISHSAFEINAQTFTGTTTMSTTDNSENLILKSTDADANVGPRLVLQRDSSSPADGDSTGKIEFTSDNDAGEATVFTTIRSEIDDASNGSEDGQVKFDMIVGGTQLTMLRFKKDEVVLNDGEADIDFRVESDGNPNMLFVDAAENRVGIGHAAPTVPFAVSANPGAVATPVAWLHNSGNVANYDGVVISSVNDGSDAEVLHVRANNNTYSNGNSLMLVRGDGAVTMPLQPAFLVQPASQQNNIGADGNLDVVAFGTERFDQNADFGSNVFTAPVAGKYHFNVNLFLLNLDSAATYYSIRLITNNRAYYFEFDPDFGQDANRFNFSFSVLADMAATHTAGVQILQTNSTSQTDIAIESYFSGHLVA